MKTVNVDTKMKSKERIGFVVVVVSPKVRVARLTLVLKVSSRKTSATKNKNELKTCPLFFTAKLASPVYPAGLAWSIEKLVFKARKKILIIFKKKSFKFLFSTASILGTTSPFHYFFIGKVGERKTNKRIITFSTNYTTILSVTFHKMRHLLNTGF